MTVAELNNEGIRSWSDIESEFEDSSILLGNGFSLNFSDSLQYKKLFQNFETECSPTAKALFTGLATYDFEAVLRDLDTTKNTLDILNIQANDVENAIKEIKQGLIDSINKIHPYPIDISLEKIKNISNQFRRFSQIYTTNYDLFLYYITINSDKFGDYFFYKYLKDPKHFQQYVEFDWNNQHHIHYLHGALFIFDKSIEVLKIIRPDESKWLLELITNEIDNNNYPLFISEGSSDKKLQAINSNKYLYQCWKRFTIPKIKKLVIYGQSLSPQDSHIVDSVDNKYDRVAVSIRVTNKEPDVIRKEKTRIASLFKKAKLDFYSADTLFNF